MSTVSAHAKAAFLTALPYAIYRLASVFIWGVHIQNTEGSELTTQDNVGAAVALTVAGIFMLMSCRRTGFLDVALASVTATACIGALDFCVSLSTVGWGNEVTHDIFLGTPDYWFLAGVVSAASCILLFGCGSIAWVIYRFVVKRSVVAG